MLGGEDGLLGVVSCWASDEMMRNDGEEDGYLVPMSNDFCFPFFLILIALFPSPRLFSVGLLACLSRVGGDELRGLRVALCSRLIASVSSGILFPVPCDGFFLLFYS